MCLNPIITNMNIPLPCGKCIECRLSRSNEWSYRIMDEASLYKDNCFVTLTYNEDNLPDGASLKRSDLQAFIKRLRRRVEPVKLRYFYCGEYGSERGRCHYHVIFFGWIPPDLYLFRKSKKGENMFRSPLVEDCWSVPELLDGHPVYLKNGKPKTNPIGFCTVELLENISQARYISLYMQKAPKDGRVRPFVGMSQGIGRGAIDFDSLKIDGNLYHNGKYIRAPRYYRKKAKEKGIDLSRPVQHLDSHKSIKRYLKEIFYRQRTFYARFPKLGKPVSNFFGWLLSMPYFFSFFFSKNKENFEKSFKNLDN